MQANVRNGLQQATIHLDQHAIERHYQFENIRTDPTLRADTTFLMPLQ